MDSLTKSFPFFTFSYTKVMQLNHSIYCFKGVTSTNIRVKVSLGIRLHFSSTTPASSFGACYW